MVVTYLLAFCASLSTNSCFCGSLQEPNVHSPYCVVLLKNNAGTAPDTDSTSPDPYNRSNQSHTLCASGPLALLTWPSLGNADATSTPAAAASTAANCSWAGLPQPAVGPQVQHTNIVEQCSQPMWDAVMQLHVANRDALLRLQVRGGLLLPTILTAVHMQVHTLHCHCIQVLAV